MRGASQRRVAQPSPPRWLTPCSWIGTPVNRQGIRGRRASRTGARPRIYRPNACVFLIIQAKYRGFTGDILRHARARPGHPRLNQSATVGWAKRSVPTVWHTALSPRWPPTPPTFALTWARRVPRLCPPYANSNAKCPRGRPAGTIPTVDFLLHHAAASVKKTAVKTHDGARAGSRATARPPASSRRVDPGLHHHRRARHRQRPRNLDRRKRQRFPAELALPRLVDGIEVAHVGEEHEHPHHVRERGPGGCAEPRDVVDDHLGLVGRRRREVRLSRIRGGRNNEAVAIGRHQGRDEQEIG